MSFGITELIIILSIIILIFGTKKLRNMGYDFGTAIKSFRDTISDENKEIVDIEKKTES